MGIQFRESSYVINDKSSETAKTDMVFNLSVRLEGLVDPVTETKYALQIADTLFVTEDVSLPTNS
jgi:nucleosome binding factor SPN SPT16 subunit